MTTGMDAADALLVLTKIKLFHPPQDDTDDTCRAWAQALTYAGVASVQDAIDAVQRRYATPGANPWITPGDVVAGVRAIRSKRLDSSDAILPDVDPDQVQDWLKARRAGLAALADGRIQPPAPIEGGRVPTELRGRVSLSPARMASVVRRPERPLPVHYGSEPLPPVKVITAEEVDQLEAARTAQLKAITAAYPDAGTQPAAVPPGPEEDPETAALAAQRRAAREKTRPAAEEFDAIAGQADVAS